MFADIVAGWVVRVAGLCLVVVSLCFGFLLHVGGFMVALDGLGEFCRFLRPVLFLWFYEGFEDFFVGFWSFCEFLFVFCALFV